MLVVPPTINKRLSHDPNEHLLIVYGQSKVPAAVILRQERVYYGHSADVFSAGKPKASYTGTPSHSAGMGSPRANAAVEAVSIV